MKQPSEIKPADGKLGVLLPGFGAVATTLVALLEGCIGMIKVNRDAEHMGKIDQGLRSFLELLRP